MPEMVALMKCRLEQRKGELIFHRDGKSLGDFKRAWNSANKRAGMDKLFHDLRRTAVRNLIAAGLSERLVMALTGHRTNHMLHRYHVLVEADLKEAMAELGAFFEKSKNGLIAS
jgi:integrase